MVIRREDGERNEPHARDRPPYWATVIADEAHRTHSLRCSVMQLGCLVLCRRRTDGQTGDWNGGVLALVTAVCTDNFESKINRSSLLVLLV